MSTPSFGANVDLTLHFMALMYSRVHVVKTSRLRDSCSLWFGIHIATEGSMSSRTP